MAAFGPGKDAPPDVDGGNALTRKIGGLPTWAWVALAAAGGAVFFIWRSRGKSTDTTATSPTPVDNEAQGLDVEQYESLLALLRDIQGEVSQQDGDDDDDDGGVASGDPTAPKPTKPPPAKTPSAPKPKPKPKPSHRTVNVSKFTTAKAAAGPNWASTLSGIARHEHTTVARLLKLNPGIKNPNILHYPGKVIVS